MNIIIKDSETGKELMLSGNGNDFELFKRSKGKEVDGEHVGSGGWTSCRRYFNDMEWGIEKAVKLLLASKDDTAVTIDVRMPAAEARRVLKARVNKITVEVMREDS